MKHIQNLLLTLCILFSYPAFAQETTQAQELESAAEAGDVAAQFQLANLYLSGAFGTSDPDKALEWYRKSAEGGYVEANIRLAELYIQGLSGKQNFDEAIKWLEKPAQQGDATAQTTLGWALIMGKQDYAEAAKWYKAAATQGYPEAISALGNLYYDGTGVVQDHKKALELYKQACDLEVHIACVYYQQRGGSN
ncbi:sel1 repeat family protein [Oligella ureolytica]|nr:sel1 repeat family protein [Alcaligenaceae bacterium]HZJ98203.1 tetratricopeptide repeat protein [Oligella sp.]